MVAQAETHDFQAETKRLLDLMIYSLYTTKDIFLRELISNASDALDRLRFEALTKPELLDDGSELEIHLESDRKARTLTISDNGIGMSRDEVVANIGTIAKSGTRELRERMQEGASNEALSELIGQFGVGFYSSFMVADRVTLLTRRAGESVATQWESAGDGHYTLSTVSKPSRGTTIILHLKPIDLENGIEDYTDKWILSRIIKRYSDFISYPIVFEGERGEKEAEQLEAAVEEEANADAEPKVLNSMKPIWTRPSSEVPDSEYVEFYRHISHNMDDPLHYISGKAEGLVEYRALVFIPSKAPHDLYYHGVETGLRLYAKGVLIVERCAELLPRYLRFLKGIVDTADLPLNISRQMLQQDRQIAQIRKWLTKKVLDALQDMAENNPEKYLKFWREFGRAFKEGASSDYENKEKILSLLRFESSNDPEQLTSLKDYVGRMKDDQQEIYYMTGESRSVVENSPHLEAFKEKGYEVLYLVDPVDELMVQSLHEYEGKRLKSALKGTLRLGDEEERARTEKELKEKQEEVSEMLQMIQKHLDAYVKEVRLTNRLTSSPACLVVSDLDYSPQMERLLMLGKGAGPKQRRIMEFNPQHEIFQKMWERYRAGQDSEALKKYAELLFGYTLIAEGSELPDAIRFSNLLTEVVSQSL